MASRGGESKTDTYLMQAFDRLEAEAAAKGLESTSAGPSALCTMLVRVRDAQRWQPPAGFTVQSRIGSIISGRGTADALAALQDDPDVLGIEASRPVSSGDSATPLTFIRADQVQRPEVGECGDRALVAILDLGIDVLHQTFLDAAGRSRIVEIWDQTDDTGPGPHAVHPEILADYGTVHTAEQIRGYVVNNSAPFALQNGDRHGTHVASIAAGRAVGAFTGGVAPEAQIVVVVTKLGRNPGDPFSTGYSVSHVDALAYVKAVANKLRMPVVVNVSQGMNAGAHDGSSLLEAAFDEFSGGGRDPGVAIVKSAGNERNWNGHARLTLGSMAADEIVWKSDPAARAEDVFELWFEACDEFAFCVRAPSGAKTEGVSWANPDWTGMLSNGNQVTMGYTRYHHDNGDSRLLITVRRGDASRIEQGQWACEVTSNQVRSDGEIHAWVERNNASRPVAFVTHLEEEVTLSIPGTAHTVIAVGATPAAFPLKLPAFTSFGPTRDRREKPDIIAPGVDIVAADAGTGTGVRPDSGTSMAAPHVTGAIALLFSRQDKQPEASVPNAVQVRAALTQNAQTFNGHFAPSTGYGLLDVEALFRAFEPLP